MATKPLVLPDPYNGEGSWTDWKIHFDNVAKVNEWDNDAKKLPWLRVRLVGKAQKALQRVPEGTFAATIKELDKRFEPQSRRSLYQAEFQTRKN